MDKVKYSDLLAKWLVEAGYSKCFSLGGGNIMHLAESVSRAMQLIPVVHEVAAGIAAEYFTETGEGQRAFALVTTGPGLTNVVTAIAGAYMESRELLVIGGQVKTADLCHGLIRQRGIQEVQGEKLVEVITKKSVRLDAPICRSEFLALVKTGWTPRKGPVFIEMPLDVQGRMVDPTDFEDEVDALAEPPLPKASDAQVQDIVARFRAAKRPVLLVGGGVSRETALQVGPEGYTRMGVPVMTTYNGASRIGSEHPLYFGRPNTFGQRYSGILVQQADFVLALGTRLGMQQSGFNWQQFVPLGDILQVDLDQAELDKGHPQIDLGLCVDANDLLQRLQGQSLGEHGEWIDFCNGVKAELPLVEPGINVTGAGYLSPYVFFDELSKLSRADDVLIPCSSGGAFTCSYQSISQKFGQHFVSDKSLASMGYGLSGAIGAALANPHKRTILIEGDGGFAQNMQEIGTAVINKVNLKMFIFDDQGYASIRMTQRSYFGGRYVGCDINTGLGLPNWEKIFPAYDVPLVRLRPGFENDPAFLYLFNADGIAAFLVTIDPEQTYLPKVTSRVKPDGSMESNPLHRLSPELPEGVYTRTAPFLVKKGL
ncbi:thiamine pyrophosphate-binding protein [Uliginosibacterium sp. 31-12]|uniref:thiamine pyrophosphate-binding protein n=1 Tax=Uliginosibacterium sp. 31-12 TaxID=3062781 RepID=UPI0026E29244|nr:thiamine pyrophosphate-binding protein [Uliginosibacterium sp. 31-12]MDO6384983.1 thiamine pyrophosphate-binding protein [Uliginosibacterium sp. 31-12]